MSKRICVFCSSSNSISNAFFDEARELGGEMARRGHSLIYGGGDIGTMGAVAHSIQDAGGRVVGVIPHALNELKGVGNGDCNELIVTETMRQRKAIMEENADAFIALPGGLGTLEELLEIVTLKQLRFHAKPIVILNASGYYDPLIAMLEHAVEGLFMKQETLSLFHVSRSIADALDYIETYEPVITPLKWAPESPPADEADVAVE